MRLGGEVGFKGFNIGALWPRAGRRYDAVKSQVDLTPKPPDAQQGSVRISNGRSHDGSPVVAHKSCSCRTKMSNRAADLR